MKMKRFIIFFQILVCSFIVLQSQGVFCAAPAEEFPAAKFTLPAPDSSQAQTYLGLKAMEPFKVSDIKARLVVIEFMSAFCPFCLTNAPIVNNIYKTIQGDSGLADVKVIAIAVGNEKAAVEAYKKRFNVPFPIMTDQDFAISVSMNGVATPTMMIVSADDGKVLFSHTGVIQDPDGFLKQLKALHKKK